MLKKLKRNWITVWLITVILLLISFVSYAEYMDRQNRVKRVVANVANAERYFTSDYLVPEDSLPQAIYFSPSMPEESCVITFKLRNYDVNTPAKYYNKNLSYELTATLVDGDGNPIGAGALGSYKIGLKQANAENFTEFSEANYVDGKYQMKLTLSSDYLFSGNSKEVKEFQLSFDKGLLAAASNIYVKLEATPSNGNLEPLKAILGVTASKADLNPEWSGAFAETTNIGAYDGFNYVISGNGASILEFGWRTDKFEANAFSIQDMLDDLGLPQGSTDPIYSRTVEGNEWSFIYIRANANDTFDAEDNLTRAGIGRYDIQMYMTGSNDSDYNSLDKINSYVSFQKVEAIPQN